MNLTYGGEEIEVKLLGLGFTFMKEARLLSQTHTGVPFLDHPPMGH